MVSLKWTFIESSSVFDANVTIGLEEQKELLVMLNVLCKLCAKCSSWERLFWLQSKGLLQEENQLHTGQVDKSIQQSVAHHVQIMARISRQK